MVYITTYKEPEISVKEILRYAGVKELTDELSALLKSCLDELRGKLSYKVCYSEFSVVRNSDCLDLGFAKTASADLNKALRCSDSIVLFAATVGVELDRLIAKYGRISPARALIFQAIATERIESLCDAFCRDIREQKAALGKRVTPRFSPGYGDLPLELQRDIFSVLDCHRKIGLTLNSSMLMSPSKSVTAIIGVEDIDAN